MGERQNRKGGICARLFQRMGAGRYRAFLPVTDGHLRGRYTTVGVYPMLADASCWFLAANFDMATWREDAAAYLAACKARGAPAAKGDENCK